MTTDKQTKVFYGIHPLTECLVNLVRRELTPIKDKIKVSLTKETRDRPEIMSLLQKHGITPTVVTYGEIEHTVGKGMVHQGVMFELEASTLYTPFETVLKREEKKEKTLFVLLDELEDPHNVGAIIRSAVAFGASALLLPSHGQADITGVVAKTSSGMNFALPIVKIQNINGELEKLKKQHFWIYGLEGSGETSLHDVSYDAKSVLIIGAEGKGVREKTLELCDFKVSIPLSARCESLNASVAASLALYEWGRGR